MARRRQSAGFTLIEVLAALLILGLALGAVLPQVSQAVQLRWRADGMEGAALVADNLLEQLGAGIPLAPAELSGRSDMYRWTLTLRSGDEAVVQDRRVVLMQADLDITWDEGRQRRSLEATTLRLADLPVGAMPPGGVP